MKRTSSSWSCIALAVTLACSACGVTYEEAPGDAACRKKTAVSGVAAVANELPAGAGAGNTDGGLGGRFLETSFVSFSGDGTAALFLGRPSEAPGLGATLKVYLLNLESEEIDWVKTADITSAHTVAVETEALLPSLAPLTVSEDGAIVVYESKYGGHLVLQCIKGGGDNGSVLVTSSRDGKPANGFSFCPSLSANGDVVAFCSVADNLVPGDTNGLSDVFVSHVRITEQKGDSGAGFSIERVSVSSEGVQANGPSGKRIGWQGPSLSANGKYVAFPSAASNLVPGDMNDHTDIFLRDLESGRIEMVSRSVSRRAGDGPSMQCAVSAAGEYVAFISLAADLVETETNTLEQVYVWNRATKEVVLVSKGPDNTPANSGCDEPSISGDGRFIAFITSATNLGEGAEHDDAVGLVVCDRDPDGNGLFESDSSELSVIRVAGRSKVIANRNCYNLQMSNTGSWIGFDALVPQYGWHHNGEPGRSGVVMVPLL